LLVHGLASNARMWDGVARRLTELGHRSAAVDLRGHGGSDKPDGGYDFVTITDDLVRVLDGLGWDRAAVAGQSWGANVVVELAHRFPGRMAGAALVDGGTIELSRQFPAWEDCERELAPPEMAGMTFDSVDRMFRTNHPDWPEAGIQGALACFERRPDGTVAPWLTRTHHLTILRHLWEQRPSALFAGTRIPVLLVPAGHGEADARSVDKARAVAAAEAAFVVARTRWFSPADHDVHAQFPDELAELLAGVVQEGFFA
jgi:pimeloyl-ACP methyl ester carboxylesterase